MSGLQCVSVSAVNEATAIAQLTTYHNRNNDTRVFRFRSFPLIPQLITTLKQPSVPPIGELSKVLSTPPPLDCARITVLFNVGIECSLLALVHYDLVYFDLFPFLFLVHAARNTVFLYISRYSLFESYRYRNKQRR